MCLEAWERGKGEAELILNIIKLLDNLLLNVKEKMLEDLDAGLSNLLENETSNGILGAVMGCHSLKYSLGWAL